MKKLRNTFNLLLKILDDAFIWYKKYLAEILVVAIGFIAAYLLKSVPYASILLGLVPTLPLIVSVFLILILIRPQTGKVLKFSFGLLILSMLLTLLRLISLADMLVEMSYLLFFSIILVNFFRIIKEEK